jgi:hypothetical protein
MATLSQTLNPLKKTAAGGLEQAPDLKTAMGNIGATVAPTSPIGGMLIGASPDATKMLGTPAQLNAAQSKQQDQAAPTDTLQTAVRQQQARSQATGQEQQKIQKSADMQALGGLGDRVTNFIDTQRQNLAAAAPTQAAANTVTAGSLIKDPAAATAALDALRSTPASDPTYMEKMKAANVALGRDLNTMIQPAEINSLYETAQQATSKSGAGVVADTLTMDTVLSDPTFGYDANSLSSLLGIPADQINKMTVKQLGDAVDSVTKSEFGESTQNTQQASSGTLGQAERGMARQVGRELSATGIRSTEADVAHLDQQIANADTVTFGGQIHTVEDLLKDDTVSGIISDYMNSAEGSPERKKLDETEPELSAFIKKNEALFHDASLQLEHGAEGFKQIQDTTKALANVGGITLDNRIMGELIKGFGKEFQTANVDPATIPILAASTGKTPLQQQTYANELNKAVQTDLVDPKELSQLNRDQVDKLGIGVDNSNWSKFTQKETDRVNFTKIDPSDTSGQLRTMVTGVTDIDGIQAAIGTGISRNALGIGDKVDTGFLDVHDLQGSYDRFNPKMKLADAANGVSVPGKVNISAPSTLSGVNKSIEHKLGQAAADGDISGDDLARANLDINELMRLEDNRGKSGAHIDGSVVQLRRQAAAALTSKVINETGFNSMLVASAAQGFINLSKGDPRKVDRPTIIAAASSYMTGKFPYFVPGPAQGVNVRNDPNGAREFITTSDILWDAGLLSPEGRALREQINATISVRGQASTKNTHTTDGGHFSGFHNDDGGHAGSSSGNAGSTA